MCNCGCGPDEEDANRLKRRARVFAIVALCLCGVLPLLRAPAGGSHAAMGVVVAMQLAFLLTAGVAAFRRRRLMEMATR
jgi:hypothetical protein